MFLRLWFLALLGLSLASKNHSHTAAIERLKQEYVLAAPDTFNLDNFAKELCKVFSAVDKNNGVASLVASPNFSDFTAVLNHFFSAFFNSISFKAQYKKLATLLYPLLDHLNGKGSAIERSQVCLHLTKFFYLFPDECDIEHLTKMSRLLAGTKTLNQHRAMLGEFFIIHMKLNNFTVPDYMNDKNSKPFFLKYLSHLFEKLESEKAENAVDTRHYTKIAKWAAELGLAAEVVSVTFPTPVWSDSSHCLDRLCWISVLLLFETLIVNVAEDDDESCGKIGNFVLNKNVAKKIYDQDSRIQQQFRPVFEAFLWKWPVLFFIRLTNFEVGCADPIILLLKHKDHLHPLSKTTKSDEPAVQELIDIRRFIAHLHHVSTMTDDYKSQGVQYASIVNFSRGLLTEIPKKHHDYLLQAAQAYLVRALATIRNVIDKNGIQQGDIIVIDSIAVFVSAFSMHFHRIADTVLRQLLCVHSHRIIGKDLAVSMFEKLINVCDFDMASEGYILNLIDFASSQAPHLADYIAVQGLINNQYVDFWEGILEHHRAMARPLCTGIFAQGLHICSKDKTLSPFDMMLLIEFCKDEKLIDAATLLYFMPLVTEGHMMS